MKTLTILIAAISAATVSVAAERCPPGNKFDWAPISCRNVNRGDFGDGGACINAQYDWDFDYQPDCIADIYLSQQWKGICCLPWKGGEEVHKYYVANCQALGGDPHDESPNVFPC
ncbi:unnamed protein product [Zymoseptoria tritici ST99CH_3D1]|nr:unnamed protein product [Zymoseptoria tritici ST99CH_3D1]